MKTILVPTDYSKEARNAFICAIEIARLAKAEIVLFHAFHKPITVANATHIENAISELERENANILQEYAAEVKEEICRNFSLQYASTYGPDTTGIHQAEPDIFPFTKSGFHRVQPDEVVAGKAAVKIKCVCKFGWAADEILLAAETQTADLVVMSTRGAGAVSQAFMGSTISIVIQSGKIPVLAIPHLMPFKGLKSLVFATDLTKWPSNDILDSLREWIKIFDANLHILHLYQHNDPQKELEKALTVLEKFDLQWYDISYKVHFQQREDIAEGIQEFAQTHQADLLVLVPKRHTFLEKLFQKSVSGKIAAKAFMPLLIFPYPAKSAPASASTKVVKEQA